MSAAQQILDYANSRLASRGCETSALKWIPDPEMDHVYSYGLMAYHKGDLMAWTDIEAKDMRGPVDRPEINRAIDELIGRYKRGQRSAK